MDLFLREGLKILHNKNIDGDIQLLLALAKEWSLDLENVYRWMKSSQYRPSKETATHFTQIAQESVDHIQGLLKTELKGQLLLSPSLMRFDGFARYDSGSHKVIFGIDHPDVDTVYLKVLLSHELSHVYRDHQPRVWEFMRKPLEQISRAEYLDNFSAQEHLVSEGLATLFSQTVFPEVPLHVHHYYSKEEMEWCLMNHHEIEKNIIETLKSDEDVWKFYSPGGGGKDSPPRVQYFWAARKIADWIKDKPGESPLGQMIWALQQPAGIFDCFKV